MATCARVVDLSLDDFRRQHLEPRQPVVFEGLAAATTPVQSWTPTTLRQRFGDLEISMADHNEAPIDFGAYVDGLENAVAGERRYLRNIFLCEHLPELLDEVTIPAFVADNYLCQSPLREVVPHEWSRWVELFVSGAGTRYPAIHADTHQTHAWLTQVYGTKRLWLWPPRRRTQQARLLDNLHRIEVDGSTDLEHALTHSPPMVADIGPGDVIFIPAGWWHTVEATSLSITLSGNFVNASNWDDFCAFNRFALAESDDDDVTALAKDVLALADAFSRT